MLIYTLWLLKSSDWKKHDRGREKLLSRKRYSWRAMKKVLSAVVNIRDWKKRESTRTALPFILDRVDTPPNRDVDFLMDLAGDHLVSHCALRLLAAMPDKEHKIKKLRQRFDSLPRRWSAAFLCDLGKDAPTDLLVRLLEDKDFHVFQQVGQVLDRRKWTPTLPVHSVHMAFATTNSAYLSDLGEEMIEPFLEVMNAEQNSPKELRLSFLQPTVARLGHIGGNRALEVLIMLMSTAKYRSIICGALKGLAVMRDQRALASLEEFLRNSTKICWIEHPSVSGDEEDWFARDILDTIAAIGGVRAREMIQDYVKRVGDHPAMSSFGQEALRKCAE